MPGKISFIGYQCPATKYVTPYLNKPILLSRSLNKWDIVYWKYMDKYIQCVVQDYMPYKIKC